MASALAAQLSQIAAHSTNSLDLKAQRTAHSQSLIFEARDAANQGFDTIFQLCYEGFGELCLLDPRFTVFARNIFSEHSKKEERTQMTAAQNEELDRVVEDFLGLVGGRLLLKPAIKAVEWLVRRFRVHEYNTSFLILTFLPYHTTPIFATLLSILPSNIPPTYKFLHPYIKSLASPPRHTIVYTATNNHAFFATLNQYVLKVSKVRHHHHALLSLWAGVMTEAVAGMLDLARSGRHNVQRQSEHDVLLRVLPILNEGLAMGKVPELQMGCYMLLTILSTKSNLEDKVLNGMMEAVVAGWTQDTLQAGLVCLSVLAEERNGAKLPKIVVKEMMKINALDDEILSLSHNYSVDRLVLGLTLGALARFEKSKDVKTLGFVGKMLEAQILDGPQISLVVKSTLLLAQNSDFQATEGVTDMRRHLADFLVRLTQSSIAGKTIRAVMQDSSIDVDLLEMKLQTAILPAEKLAIAGHDDMDMQDIETPAVQTTFESITANLPTRTVDEISFISHVRSRVFDDLLQSFILAAGLQENIEKFINLPILRKEFAANEPLFFSFFMRVWCGPYPALSRVAALQTTGKQLANLGNVADFQAILPYLLIALADPSAKVRHAAAELATIIDQLHQSKGDQGKKRRVSKPWGFDEIYGMGEETKGVKWLSSEEITDLLQSVVLPALEECTLDNNHIKQALDRALDGSSHPKQTGQKELKKSVGVAIMSFLSSHVVNTPLYTAKVRLLQMLCQVNRIKASSRTKMLLPALKAWASLSETDATDCCQAEELDQRELDEQMAGIISESDKEGLSALQQIVTGEYGSGRPGLVQAMLHRLQILWSSLKADTQLSMADFLLDSSLDLTPKAYQDDTMDVLRSLRLPTNVLVSFVDQLPAAADVKDGSPSAKRRRTSHGAKVAVNAYGSGEMGMAVRKVTSVLEIVDSSEPEKHPQLLKGLFQVLGELQHYKVQLGSELAYIQGLVLGSLLDIANGFQGKPDAAIDSSSVQNAALLLVSSLASIAPELVLHSVMPIFTFMGATVLRQDDEYSAHVIDKTVQQVIPPLIQSLRQQSGDPLRGAAELLLSFVTAFEHVPSHRRLHLYKSLVEMLGPEDFLFALLAMLADKYAADGSVQGFTVDLMGNFGVQIQLIALDKYLSLAIDTLGPNRELSELLLSLGDKDEREIGDSTLTLLQLLHTLLASRPLIVSVNKGLTRRDIDIGQLRSVYSSLLEKTLTLMEAVKDQKKLHAACANILEALLGLVSTPEFIDSISTLIERPDDQLRRKILKSLEFRIRNERQGVQTSRKAILGFLPRLTYVVQNSPDVQLKCSAISCIDQISEKYGRTDTEAILASADIVAGDHCLGSEDDRLRVIALLCLASVVDVLGAGIIAVLPKALPKALDLLKLSLEEDAEKPELHNAAYSFLGAILTHVPWMITGPHLDTLLTLSHASAEADMNGEAGASRLEVMHLASRQLDAKECFSVVERNWANALESGPSALKEHLDLFALAVEHHSKSTIMKNTKTLSSIFLLAFDLRRMLSSTNTDEEAFDMEDIEELEEQINKVAIAMIYKMNDSTFRPLFERLLEWALTSLPKKDRQGRTLRLTSLYSFFITFFDNLKASTRSYNSLVVTSYILENAVDVLNNVVVDDDESEQLWSRVLRALLKSFEHDQDDFWQSPSHFNAVSSPLLSQFVHASKLPITSELIPTITELAAAADSADHHKELNAAIMKHMRSDNASARLAAVKCEQSLTERLGEDWLSLLPEMLPFISELQEDDDENVERETHRWIAKIEDILGESLEPMLQ
ncbi:MAG: hypothetical protein M1819_006267 [Sarea resinae]|nr:MAG: hypothetical protein M1819_006267 [Sarea resinae]